MTETETIDVKVAAQTAAKYLKEMIPAADGLLLEEVEKSEYNNVPRWIITISFQLDMGSASGGLIGFQRAMGKRDYKTLTVNAETGEVISMKIRAI